MDLFRLHFQVLDNKYPIAIIRGLSKYLNDWSIFASQSEIRGRLETEHPLG